MIVTRWLAPLVPKPEQMHKWFEKEGLTASKECLKANSHFKNLRHPFDNIILVAEGELLLNVTGNKILLRPGDKVVIPSNTKFSKQVNGEKDCLLLIARKAS